VKGTFVSVKVLLLVLLLANTEVWTERDLLVSSRIPIIKKRYGRRYRSIVGFNLSVSRSKYLLLCSELSVFSLPSSSTILRVGVEYFGGLIEDVAFVSRFDGRCVGGRRIRGVDFLLSLLAVDVVDPVCGGVPVERLCVIWLKEL